MYWRVLNKRIHSSWLISLLSIGIVAGIVSAQVVESTWFTSLVWLLAGSMLAVFVFWQNRLYTCIFMIIAGGMIGLWRGCIDQYALGVYRNVIDYTATIQGKISDDPEFSEKNGYELKLHDIAIDGHSVPGSIWVSTAKVDAKRGDVVTLRGKVSKGFGSFAATLYRAKVVKLQRPQPGDVAGQVRDWFALAVRGAIPEPQASLGIGYLVGQKSTLPEDLTAALQIAGLTHIVVASGYNLTILVRLTRRLFVKISKYLAAATAGGMIMAFIMITGMSPSMSRAGLVAGLSLLAWYYGRRFHPLVLLPFAAAVTVLMHPAYAWGDLGWLLSFAAFAGVMIVAPLMQRYFFGDKKPGTLRQILGETSAAQLTTLPILLMTFGQISNVALLANALILPFVPFAMLLTFAAGLGALVAPGMAEVIGWPASILLHYMTTLTQYLADAPWAQTTLQLDGTGVGVFYVVLSGGCMYMWRKTRLNLRDSSIVE